MKSVFVFAIPLVVAALAYGDHVELLDGRQLDGKILKRTEHMVQIRTEDGKLLSFPIARVRDIHVGPEAAPGVPATQPDEGPTYFIVPLRGAVGREIAADKMRDAFNAGLRNPETVLVLIIDSGGGSTTECEEIVKLMAEQQDRRTIAYVLNAYSAAAIIALTCDDVYLDRAGSIGAATAYAETHYGLVSLNKLYADEAVGEKFASIWRNTCRKAAEVGGHNTLLAEAMVDRNVRLVLTEEDGKPRVEQAAAAGGGRDGRVVSERGKLLTLTAHEAVDCGLARQVVAGVDEVLAAAKMEGWRPASVQGVAIMTEFAVAIAEAEKKLEALDKEIAKLIEDASATDPTKASYLIEANTGRMTRDARRKWQALSRECAQYLTQIERLCVSGARISRSCSYTRKKYEGLFIEYHSRIKETRKAIEEDKNRRNLYD